MNFFNMTSLMLPLVFLLFALIVHDSAGSLRIDVTPTKVWPGLTDSLTVNCSFSFAEISNISGIITLIVSKSDQQEQFVDLVSLNAFTPDDVTTLTQVDGKVSGHIDLNHESYLSLVLPSPTDNDAGLYRCEMNGIDNHGHSSKLFETSFVTSQPPIMDQLMNKINQLQDQLQRQESQAKNQSEEISECQSQLKLQENLAKNKSNVLLTKILGVDFYVSEEYNDHYYLLSKQARKNASVAAQACQDFGGYLAQITDHSENQFLKDFVGQYSSPSSSPSSLYIYVSGTDAEQENQWTFTGTATVLVFFDWGPNEGISGDCLALQKDSQWQWADIVCTSSQRFLCELETL